MKITRINALDGLELKEATFQGHVFPAHFHDSYSLGLIEEGLERMTYADRSFVAPARSVLVVNPFDIHANAFVDADPWRYRALYVSVDLVRFVARRQGWAADAPVWFPREVIQDDWLYAHLLRVHQAPPSHPSAPAVLETVVAHLVRHYATVRPEATFVTTGTQTLMSDAAAYIRQHADAPLTVEALATHYHLDKFAFVRAFKQVNGLPPIAYALLQRINHAKTLLATDAPLVEVALAAGFYDQSHFTNYFKRYLGVTPVAYRRALVSIALDVP